MRTNMNTGHAWMNEKMLDHGLQSLFIHVLAKEYSNSQLPWKRADGHQRIVLSPAVHKYTIHSATVFDVGSSGGLAMNQRQIVGQPCDWPDRHAVRDKHNWSAVFSRGQIKGDAMRITVI